MFTFYQILKIAQSLLMKFKLMKKLAIKNVSGVTMEF